MSKVVFALVLVMFTANLLAVSISIVLKVVQ